MAIIQHLLHSERSNLNKWRAFQQRFIRVRIKKFLIKRSQQTFFFINVLHMMDPNQTCKIVLDQLKSGVRFDRIFWSKVIYDCFKLVDPKNIIGQDFAHNCFNSSSGSIRPWVICWYPSE